MNISQKVYGLKNGQPVHVSEVSRGLKCGCSCEKCGKSLIAKKGKVRKHHFSHFAKTDCAGSLETILHLLAKEIFKELPTVFLPQYNFEKTKKLKSILNLIVHRQLIVKGGEAVITKVSIEKSEGKFKPDITIQSNTKTLFVEIAVTHKINREKLRNIRKRGLPAIEIHLDGEDAVLTKSELKDKLQKDLKSKSWLFHPNQREAEKAFIEKIRNARRNSKKPAVYSNRIITNKFIPRMSTKLCSREHDDKMRYDFFCKFNRQPTDEEAAKLASILARASIHSYAYAKSKK